MTCEHVLVRGVLVGGPKGDQVMWLCADSDCKQEFIPIIQDAVPGYDGSDFDWFVS